MFGLMVFGAMGLYLLLSIVVVFKAAGHARAQGKSVKRWGWSAALVMYLIPFWDFLPTIAVHQYVCATESGFWVYKTVDQWKAENPGVMEKFKAPDSSGMPIKQVLFDNGHGKTNVYRVNDRVSWAATRHDVISILPISRVEHYVIDEEMNEVLARYIDYKAGSSVKNTVGPPGPLKFWLNFGGCYGGSNNQDNLRKYLANYYGDKE